VNAFHSKRSEDGAYLGEAPGSCSTFENGTTLYFAGDTCVFGDMQLIGGSTRPTWRSCRSAALHDGPAARRASRSSCSGRKRCIPCHYGTFPVLAGTPDELRQHAPGVDVIELQPGETTTV
jgi:L-ascorbate metabolism protein UlaG (beta-lactamase superfamily)